MQLHNNHQRLVKRLLPRFSPTWLGDPEPAPTTTAGGISAVGPPAAVTTTSAPAPTPTPQATQTPPTTAQLPATTKLPVSVPVEPTSATPTTPSVTDVVPTTSSTLLTTSTEVPTTTSAAPTTTQPASSSTPVQPTTTPRQSVAQTSAPANSGTRTTLAAVKTFTNASGGVIYSTVYETPSPTASVAPASSGKTGTIVGAVAGTLLGVVCLIAFISWLVRQHNKRKRGNNDDFDRQSYLRNSMMIPDDTPGAGRPVIGTQAALALARANMGAGPRPPTMIERKPTYLMNGQPSPSFTPGQVVSFEPGQVVAAPLSASNGYPSPMAFAAYTPPAEHHQTELSRRPSGAQLLTRQPTNGGMYDQVYQNSPAAYSPEGYHAHDGYTYPMQGNREMIQSVTPYQAQQYAEITRQLEGHPADYGNESFHPISPASPSPLSGGVGYAITEEPEPMNEKHLPNPFDDKVNARIDSTPPSLPPLGVEEGRLSRTGTPIDPNPQHAHWSYDAKGAQPGSRLSVAGLGPAVPSPAYTREDRAVIVGNGEAMSAPPNTKRPVSIVDEDDVYGGM
ncbi:hypothetical protein FRC07_005428 [Ceratobasidium sp. 392]|nr:hypothetical protein FRC07_005428 [Ceratobasidium sp. 392]